jgi:hypothetical protein
VSTASLILATFRTLTTDAWLLFITRFTRLFAYGSLSVILIFYLVSLGLSETQSGLVLTLTLTGDIAVSLYLTCCCAAASRRKVSPTAPATSSFVRESSALARPWLKT